jgi:alkanesulfonate monooxygenase SsuD/methylene tetrahydromethanopterin reductase-like flavin-dependent oxidoreductase (luciferase family)
MGGTRRAPGERLGALEEAIHIIRGALDASAGRIIVRGPGPNYPIPGYPPGPPSAHRVEIWVGAMAPGALRLIGRVADGWVPGSGISAIDRFGELTARIDDAALAAGRDPTTIRRIVNVSGVITDGPSGSGRLEGPVAQWIETLTTWAMELGLDAYLFSPPDALTEQVERFAAEVAPAVRAAVGSGVH